MKTRILTLLLLLPLMGAAQSHSVAKSDTVAYNIVYKWGFIDKTAGQATVSLNVKGDSLRATLSGHSIPWGGRVYSAADSLSAVFVTDSASSSLGSLKVTSLTGRYRKPLVVSDVGGQLVLSKNNPYRAIDGSGTLDADAATMEAITICGYMLSLYHYAAVIPFSDIQPGWKATVAMEMPSPAPAEHCTLTYQGSTTYTASGSSVPSYALVVNFTYKGAPSNYPVTIIVDAATRQILQISATLKIGHMEMQIAAPKAG